MKSFAALALLALAALASPVSAARNYLDEHAAIINTVNSLNTTWTSHHNLRFLNAEGWNAVRRQLGALPAPNGKKSPLKFHELINIAAIPDTFDARTAWPNCESIGEVRDQSDCGSCWAFGAAEAGTDRICIGTKGAVKAHLSVTDLLSCCSSCGDGCNGGYPGSAWDYMASTGLVTGGNYLDNTLCQAYPFTTCDHHVTGKYTPCDSLGPEYPTPTCSSSCDANSTYSTTYAADKHIFASSYSIANDVAQIQHEIMTNGPVEGAFSVYADFPTYKSGVYQYTTGDMLGGHAIKIYGWGTENGVAYWRVANSWNNDWGMNGSFLIRRGTDECGIEDGIVAGLYKA